MAEALAALPIPPVRISVNNRKVAQGFYEAIGLEDVESALRVIDKLDKIGPEAVAVALRGGGRGDAAAGRPRPRRSPRSAASTPRVADQVLALGVRSELLDEGLGELVALLEAAEDRAPGTVVADLKIARGLDYYTGSVYETTLVGHENARLDLLRRPLRLPRLRRQAHLPRRGAVDRRLPAARPRARRRPGAATRGRCPPPSSSPSPTRSTAAPATAVARTLRARGIPTDVAPTAAKFGKQIRYADRRGIPFVWFLGDGGDEVKDIRSGEQVPADAATWTPPQEDLWPRVVVPVPAERR